VNDYIAAGGSGFDVLKRNSSKQDTGISLRDSLIVYLTKLGGTCNGVPSSEWPDYSDPSEACKAAVANNADNLEMVKAACRTVTQRYGDISCLDTEVEKHDGRIRPVFED